MKNNYVKVLFLNIFFLLGVYEINGSVAQVANALNLIKAVASNTSKSGSKVTDITNSIYSISFGDLAALPKAGLGLDSVATGTLNNNNQVLQGNLYMYYSIDNAKTWKQAICDVNGFIILSPSSFNLPDNISNIINLDKSITNITFSDSANEDADGYTWNLSKDVANNIKQLYMSNQQYIIRYNQSDNTIETYQPTQGVSIADIFNVQSGNALDAYNLILSGLGHVNSSQNSTLNPIDLQADALDNTMTVTIKTAKIPMTASFSISSDVIAGMQTYFAEDKACNLVFYPTDKNGFIIADMTKEAPEYMQCVIIDPTTGHLLTTSILTAQVQNSTTAAANSFSLEAFGSTQTISGKNLIGDAFILSLTASDTTVAYNTLTALEKSIGSLNSSSVTVPVFTPADTLSKGFKVTGKKSSDSFVLSQNTNYTAYNSLIEEMGKNNNITNLILLAFDSTGKLVTSIGSSVATFKLFAYDSLGSLLSGFPVSFKANKTDKLSSNYKFNGLDISATALNYPFNLKLNWNYNTIVFSKNKKNYKVTTLATSDLNRISLVLRINTNKALLSKGTSSYYGLDYIIRNAGASPYSVTSAVAPEGKAAMEAFVAESNPIYNNNTLPYEALALTLVEDVNDNNKIKLFIQDPITGESIAYFDELEFNPNLGSTSRALTSADIEISVEWWCPTLWGTDDTQITPVKLNIGQSMIVPLPGHQEPENGYNFTLPLQGWGTGLQFNFTSSYKHGSN